MDVRSALRPRRATVFPAIGVSLILSAAPCLRSRPCYGWLWPTSRESSTVRPDPADTDKLEVTDRGHPGRRTRPEHPTPSLTPTKATADAATATAAGSSGGSPSGNAVLMLGIIGAA